MIDGSINEMKFTCERLSADVTIFTADISPSRENARRVFHAFPKDFRRYRCSRSRLFHGLAPRESQPDHRQVIEFHLFLSPTIIVLLLFLPPSPSLSTAPPVARNNEDGPQDYHWLDRVVPPTTSATVLGRSPRLEMMYEFVVAVLNDDLSTLLSA